MIIHSVVQGSQEWHRLRMGIPTASEFERIITPAKWEPTKGDTRRKYMVELLTALILDEPLKPVTASALDHGHDWEDKAVAAYEMLYGVDVERVGFCTNDTGTVGCSPDGFIGQDGGVEIKCPEKPEIHVGYMLDPETLKQNYFVQTQGQLYVTGRKWTDLISYFSGLDMVCVRVFPVAEFQAKLHAALTDFCGLLSANIERAKAAGWISTPSELADHCKDFISADDAEMIIEDLKSREAWEPK